MTITFGYIDMFVLEHIVNLAKGLGAAKISICKTINAEDGYSLSVYIMAEPEAASKLISLMNSDDRIMVKKIMTEDGVFTVKMTPVKLTLYGDRHPEIEIVASVRREK